MNHNRHINIPIFIPHMGCPHNCVFCDQKKISGTLTHQSPLRVKSILEESFSTIENTNEVEIAFFGGSFTGIPEKDMITYLELAQPYLKDGRASGIRLSTRPDTIDPHILAILIKHGVIAIELGVQSLDSDVLHKSQRGHSVEDVEISCNLIKESGISLGIQTMLGLPNDNLKKSLDTAKGVIKLKPDMVRIYPALVLKNTLLEEYYLRGEYTPLSVEEAIEWCTEILPLYREEGIKVLRIGLQASDTLKDSIIAGPYHPAFGELVESRILYKKIINKMDKLSLGEKKSITIITRPKLVSKLVGQKRANVLAIKEKYGLDDVVVKLDSAQEEFDIII